MVTESSHCLRDVSAAFSFIFFSSSARASNCFFNSLNDMRKFLSVSSFPVGSGSRLGNLSSIAFSADEESAGGDFVAGGDDGDGGTADCACDR